MDSKIVRTVLSAWGWLMLVLSVLLFTPVVAFVRLITMPFDRGAYAAGYIFRKVVVLPSALNPLWSFTTSGTLPDDMRRPYVVVANHESFVDMLLISHLPTEMKWLSKVEIMKIPFLGWMMKCARDIPLVRGDRNSAALAIEQCKKRLDSNVSVMIFPEGRRTKSGELNTFKPGAFRLAIESGHPILPMAVHGTRGCLRSNDWRMGKATAEVRVLEPIETTGMTRADLPALRDRVRSVVSAARDELRAEHGYVVPVGEQG
ncbi:MAG: 1-acyl-sn-glycerol-3-phosphate acyltransferase [Candidatus Aldehydirespiratoraceae bacterium]